MRIELLYFDGCPSYEELRELLADDVPRRVVRGRRRRPATAARR